MKVNEVGSMIQESCMYGSIGIKLSQSEDTNNVLFLQNSSLKLEKKTIKSHIVNLSMMGKLKMAG